MAKRSLNRRKTGSSSDSESTSSSSSDDSSSSKVSSKKRASNYNEIKKEVFIWVDSEFRDTYVIDDKLTWAEQKEEIITKLIPPLYKLVNKKYNVSNKDLLDMLYGRWRSRHRVKQIETHGQEQVKINKRRVAKNTRTQNKKKRRANAVDYLMKGEDQYIRKYPESDLVKILKDSGFHSSEWEETDQEEINSGEVAEDDEIVIEETTQKKTTSLYVYEKWWRSSSLKRLLHNRVDPTVQLLRQKEPILRQKRTNKVKTTSAPPIGAPSWCLSEAALRKLGRSTDNIPNYDPEDDDIDDIDDIDDRSLDHQNINEDDNDNNAESSKRNKKKNKSHKKKEKHRKKKSKTRK